MNPFEKISKDLIFEALIPGLEEFMPIVAAKNFDSGWLTKVRHSFKEHLKEEKDQIQKSVHVARCPGINSLIKTGWIIRTWQDICIETYGDLEKFNWFSPIDQSAICPTVGDIVQWHPKEHFFKQKNNFPKDTLYNVLKICLPWQIIIPKEFNLLISPVAYDDNTTFTTLSGMFTFGIAPCNIQMLWHVTNGKTLIPAGTAIAQCMLVPEKQSEAIVRRAENTLAYDVYKLHLSSKFYPRYSASVNLNAREE
jgi:hypothetical protein